MNTFREIMQLIEESDFCILYNPMKNEINPEILPFRLPSCRAFVPQGLATDPKVFGKEVIKKFKHLYGFILIPGRKFDRHGGRHGKGYGWYDRFLSSLPVRWIRIGICQKPEFSEAKLTLKKWDEVVDWVIVNCDSRFDFYETLMRVDRF